MATAGVVPSCWPLASMVSALLTVNVVPREMTAGVAEVAPMMLKVITSPLLADAIASRREPAPASLALVTVMVAANAGRAVTRIPANVGATSTPAAMMHLNRPIRPVPLCRAKQRGAPRTADGPVNPDFIGGAG